MLRLGEFAYSLHVVRIENIIFDGQGVILYFPSSKTHQLPFCQHVRIKPQPQYCPIHYLREYLKVKPVTPGALYIKENNTQIQYPAVLALFNDLAQFLDLTVHCYKPHLLRIRATTEMHIQGFNNSIIKQRDRWALTVFQRYIRPQ